MTCRTKSPVATIARTAGSVVLWGWFVAGIVLFDYIIGETVLWWRLAAPLATVIMAAAAWNYLQYRPQDRQPVLTIAAFVLIVPIGVSTLIYAATVMGDAARTGPAWMAASSAMAAIVGYTILLAIAAGCQHVRVDGEMVAGHD